MTKSICWFLLHIKIVKWCFHCPTKIFCCRNCQYEKVESWSRIVNWLCKKWICYKWAPRTDNWIKFLGSIFCDLQNILHSVPYLFESERPIFFNVALIVHLFNGRYLKITLIKFCFFNALLQCSDLRSASQFVRM